LGGGEGGAFGGALALIGIGPAIWGFAVYTESTNNAEPTEATGLNTAPVVLTDGEQTYYGAGVAWSW